jgi:hypothetical protein
VLEGLVEATYCRNRGRLLEAVNLKLDKLRLPPAAEAISTSPLPIQRAACVPAKPESLIAGSASGISFSRM